MHGRTLRKERGGTLFFNFLFYLNILSCQLYARRLFSIILDARQEVAFMLLKEKFLEIYAKIISLDFYENPIESIEGKVTGGNINIDGNSSVRRSCSLTLVSD